MIKGYHGVVMEKYNQLRQQEEKALQKRKEEAEAKAPKLREIEQRVAKLSVELAMLNFRRTSNHEEDFKVLKEKILSLRGQRAEILTSLGYSLSHLEHHYHCDQCQDTGYIRQKKCTCYKKYLIEAYNRTSNFNDLIKNYTFENFKLDLFSSTSGNYPLSPKENMTNILEASMNYIRTFPHNHQSLLFFGSPGTGKTYLSSCIAKELLEDGFLVVYRTADSLIQNLKDVKFNDNHDLFDLLLNCNLLIIDDLGTELTTEFSKVELFNFLNAKLLRKKKMIISTNLTIENLKKKYDERIYSRLVGDFNLYKFIGDDLRIKNSHERMLKAQD